MRVDAGVGDILAEWANIVFHLPETDPSSFVLIIERLRLYVFLCLIVAMSKQNSGFCLESLALSMYHHHHPLRPL